MSELLSADAEFRKPKSKRFGLVLPGASSTTPGMSALQTEFSRAYGDGNAVVYNSALLSNEPAAPARYGDIAALLEGQLATGKDVDVYLLSMGAPEFAQTIDSLSVPVEELAARYKDKLHITLYSPTLPKTRREGFRYIKNFGKVGVQEAVELPRPIPTRTRLLRGINSLVTVPSEDFDQHGDTYVQSVRSAASRLSQATEAPGELPFNPDLNRNYMTVFDAQVYKAIKQIDSDLLLAGEHGDDRKVRQLMQRRVHLIRPQIRGIYAGAYAEAVGDTPNVTPQIEKSAEGKRAGRKLLVDTFWKPQVVEKLSALADAEVDMRIIVPEYDILMKHEEALEFADNRPNVSVNIAAFTTHGFPWSARPEITLAAAKRS